MAPNCALRSTTFRRVVVSAISGTISKNSSLLESMHVGIMAESNTTLSVISHPSANPTKNEHADERQIQPTVRLTTLLAVIAFFIVTLLALSLGLGRGVGLHRNNTILQEPSSKFNYSSIYVIPEDLPVVDSAQLVNTTELDLRTGFVVSNLGTSHKSASSRSIHHRAWPHPMGTRNP